MVHGCDPRVVDEHVEVAVGLPELREHRTHRRLIRDVEGVVAIGGERVVDRLAAAAYDFPAGGTVVLHEVLAEALAGPADKHPPRVIGHDRPTALLRTPPGCPACGRGSSTATWRAHRPTRSQ